MAEQAPRRDLFQEAATLTDRIDLQGSSVSREFYERTCARCPANDGGMYNVTDRRHLMYCSLQAAILLGNVSKAINVTNNVLGEQQGDPGCPPIHVGKRMKEYERFLEENDDR